MCVRGGGVLFRWIPFCAAAREEGEFNLKTHISHLKEKIQLVADYNSITAVAVARFS